MGSQQCGKCCTEVYDVSRFAKDFAAKGSYCPSDFQSSLVFTLILWDSLGQLQFLSTKETMSRTFLSHLAGISSSSDVMPNDPRILAAAGTTCLET